MANRLLPPPIAIKTLVRAPRVRIESVPMSHRVSSLADDGFAVAGTQVEPGLCTHVAFQFGRHVSVSLRVRAEPRTEREQRFSVVDGEGRSLMRLVRALSEQDLADWLARAPTPPWVC